MHSISTRSKALALGVFLAVLVTQGTAWALGNGCIACAASPPSVAPPRPHVEARSLLRAAPVAIPVTVEVPEPRVARSEAPVASGSCEASYFDGGTGASGSALVGDFAAHKSFPFHSRWRITGPNGSVVVTVLDRGPFIAGRCWDLSPSAFAQIAPLGAGVAQVTYAPA